MKKISKKQLDKMFEKYPPNRWTKLVYKYFSKETEKKNMVPRKTLTGILLSFFIIGLLGTIFNLSRQIVGITTFAYAGLLVLLVLFMFTGAKMNDFRISKIRRELGLSKAEYQRLVDKYY